MDDNDDLERHFDDRGLIADVFYNSNLNHVAYVKSKIATVRGNHFHKLSTQHILMVKGEMEYWYKNLDSLEKSRMTLVKVGDLISTPPFEIHTLRFLLDENEFIVFTEGPRGGKDYELDTVRVDNIIS